MEDDHGSRSNSRGKAHIKRLNSKKGSNSRSPSQGKKPKPRKSTLVRCHTESVTNNMAEGVLSLHRSKQGGGLARTKTLSQKKRQLADWKAKQKNEILLELEERGPEAMEELRRANPSLYALLMKAKTD